MSWRRETTGKVAAGHRRGLPMGVDWAIEEDATWAEADCALVETGEGRTRSSGEGATGAMDAFDGGSAGAPRGAVYYYLEGARPVQVGIGRLGRRIRGLEAERRWRRDWETADEVSAAARGQLAWHRSSEPP